MSGPSAAPASSPIARLSSAFQSFLDALPQMPAFGAPEKMRKAEEAIRATVMPGSGLSDKEQCRAVMAFRAKGADRLNRREVRALCAGLNHACVVCNGFSLMNAAPDAANELLTRIAHGFKEKKLHAESWYDLLQCYIAAPDRTVCCEMLRDLLVEISPLIDVDTGYPFHWPKDIQDNSDILTKEPCKAAAAQMLAGKPGGIEAMRRSLGVPDNSWFWRELTVARASQAVKLKDAGFIAAVPALLQAAYFLPEGLRDQLLRQFLERCVKAGDIGMQEDLRNTVLECWGAPPLSEHPQYDLLSAEARAMFQEWLVRDDVKDFLTLFGDDERKLSFWNRYFKSIEFHRVLIGPEAQRAPQPAIAQLRARSTAAKLAGCPDDTSALVMKMGVWLLVETNIPNTPLYGYRLAQAPFQADAAEVDLPCLRKNGAADFKLARQDTLEGMWEDKLVTELATLGIRRADAGAARAKAASPTPKAAKPARAPLDNEAFQVLLREAHLQAEDTRPQGGALWVVGDVKDNYYLAQRLAALGFRWKAGRGWWRY